MYSSPEGAINMGSMESSPQSISRSVNACHDAVSRPESYVRLILTLKEGCESKILVRRSINQVRSPIGVVKSRYGAVGTHSQGEEAKAEPRITVAGCHIGPGRQKLISPYHRRVSRKIWLATAIYTLGYRARMGLPGRGCCPGKKCPILPSLNIVRREARARTRGLGEWAP